MLALRDTPIIWASTLRHPVPALSLLARLPSSQLFLARIAPYRPNSSAAVVTYQAYLQLAQAFLIIRSPVSSSPDQPVIGVLPLAEASIAQVRPGVLAFAGILLEPHPRDFSAIAAALSRVIAKPCLPTLSRFEILHTIAVGARAKIYAVRDRESGEKLAVKLLRRPENESQVGVWRTQIVHERAILERVRGNPYVLDLRHAILFQDTFALFFETCPHNLFDVIRIRGSPLTDEEAAAIIAQLVLAIAAVHAAGGGVTAGPGRGFRPENILFDNQGWVRLASFGLCTVLDQGMLDEAHVFRKQIVASKKKSHRSKEGRTRRQSARKPESSSHVSTTGDAQDVPSNIRCVSKTAKSSERNVGGDLESFAPKNPVGDTKPEVYSQTSSPGVHEKLVSNVSTLAEITEKSDGTDASHSADLWGLGVLTHYALTGEFPCQDSDVVDEGSASSSDDEDGKQCKLGTMRLSPAIQNDEARDFITGLLHRDSKKRLGCGAEGVRSLRRHPWLSHIAWDDIEKRNGPYALRIEKYKDTHVLDLGEQDTRETLSSRDTPEGFFRGETRGRRLSKLLSRESREGKDSEQGEASPRTQSGEGIEKNVPLKGEKMGTSDESFVFGFGFSSAEPAFSTGILQKVKPTTVARQRNSVETRKRWRWSGSLKEKSGG